MMSTYLDVGGELADSLLAAASASLVVCELEAPGVTAQFTGSSIPLADGCEGLLWTRVITTFPADARNRIIDTTTWDSRQSAFAFSIELGHMHCHRSVEEDGSYPDMSEETGYVERNNAWRMALMRAVYFEWKDQMSASLLKVVQRFTLTQPWQQIGPEGSYSGGALNVTASASTLAIPGS